MPRNGSGGYSLPGATFPYVSGELIQASEMNSNMNDLGAEIASSVAKDGQTPMTGNLNMAGNKVSSLGSATNAGQAVRFEEISDTANLNITSSGSKTLPSLEGSLTRITTSGVYNITGFSAVRPGKVLTFLIVNTGLTFVHSANFKLRGGVDRTFFGGEVIQMINTSSGIWEEIGTIPILDLSSYSGADIKLEPGQQAKYNISAVTSLLLRIAISDNQGYEIDGILNQAAGAAIGTLNSLLVNNALLGAANIAYQTCQGVGAAASASSANTTAFGLDAGNVTFRFNAKACNKLASKSLISNFYSLPAAGTQAGIINNTWLDTVTAWTSLGTISFNRSTSGTIIVRRLF